MPIANDAKCRFHSGQTVFRGRLFQRLADEGLGGFVATREKDCAVAAATSEGSIGRSVGMAPSIIRRWPDSPALTWSTSHISLAFD